MFDTEDQHAIVRNQLMDFLVQSKTEAWVKYLGGTGHAEQYANFYRNPKEWGEASQLILAAQLYKTNFVLFDPESPTRRFINFPANYEMVGALNT